MTLNELRLTDKPTKAEENSLQYYLGGRDAEDEFIKLIHNDKYLMQGADEICD